jgi:hypothetical protein
MSEAALTEANAYGIVDAAKRCSDIVNLHALVHSSWMKWVAIRLNDGGSDGVLYDTRADAIRHQYYEEYCAYVCIPPSGMTQSDAREWLSFNRALYDAGWHLADPEQANISPVRMEDAQRKLAQLRKNKVR